LQPNQAVNVLNDRVKLITSINASIADWLQVSAHERDCTLQERQTVLPLLFDRTASFSSLLLQQPYARKLTMLYRKEERLKKLTYMVSRSLRGGHSKMAQPHWGT
jgi:hypothetical protein